MAILLLLASLTPGLAQYTMEWTSIDGGGGLSTGGVYSVNGTIGQPDAGILTNGSFALAGGFWGTVTAVQTPGAPQLSLACTNGVAILSWTPVTADFSLEQTPTLTASLAAWTAVTNGQVQTNAAKVLVSVPIAHGNTFFRLRKP